MKITSANFAMKLSGGNPNNHAKFTTNSYSIPKLFDSLSANFSFHIRPLEWGRAAGLTSRSKC